MAIGDVLDVVECELLVVSGQIDVVALRALPEDIVNFGVIAEGVIERRSRCEAIVARSGKAGIVRPSMLSRNEVRC